MYSVFRDVQLDVEVREERWSVLVSFDSPRGVEASGGLHDRERHDREGESWRTAWQADVFTVWAVNRTL